MLRALSLSLFALVPTTATAFATPNTPLQQQATLKVGDAAPALSIEKWIKGGPIAKFEPGHVYVVEFWATWCGPCIASMPHISALQSEYAGKATVIGTNIWERPIDEKTLDKVTKFVEAQGERMAYTVAYDGPSKAMDMGFMKASGRGGIPSAFIVDQKGVIAWMGHPASMDFALHEIVEGKWDLANGPAREKEVNERLKSIRSKLRSDGAAAQAAFDKFAADYPFLAKHQDDLKFELLKANGKWDEVYAILGKQVDAAIASKSAMQLNQIAWGIVDPDAEIAKRDLVLALRAAQAAVEFSEKRDAAILDTLARVHAWKGEMAKAIEIQTLAVELAMDAMREDLQKVLDEYKSKSAL